MNVTDRSLFVKTSMEEEKSWDRKLIADSLVLETGLDRPTAERISLQVEEELSRLSLSFISAPLIREITNVKLLENGLEPERKRYTRLGMPSYDLSMMFRMANKENANVPYNPESINLSIAEATKKEFALLHVFSDDVSRAHMHGDVHLHDLGFVDRPYCSGQSLEYVKKFGLHLHGKSGVGVAKPARHPEVLILHLSKFSAALQGNFAGAIGWDAVNTFIAPYLKGLSEERIDQLAQEFIYEFAQQAVARGGQVTFSDINIYWECPKHFEDVQAIGPGGKYTGDTYADYLHESQSFATALFRNYLKGDSEGKPFFFPKPLVHITDKFFKTEGHEEFMSLISDVAAEKGNTYYVFDRGEQAKISECCRLQFKLNKGDLEDAKSPWKMRYSAIQNVSMNLPRLAYLAKGDDTRLFELLDKNISLIVKAHKQKKQFIASLLSHGINGSLALLSMDLDGEPYYRLHRVTYLVGLVGLNELVQAHTGEELHESRDALKFGLKVVSYLRALLEAHSKETGMHLVLEQTPAETTVYRFAKMDLKFHPEASSVVKGDFTKGNIYYTNSTYLNVSSQSPPFARVKQEGIFHPLIDAGALTHIWLADSRPESGALGSFVKKTFTNTDNTQIAFSPEFTVCKSCSRTSRGLSAACSFCGSDNIDAITRITGYFSLVSNWNPGKLGELKDRYRTVKFFEGGSDESVRVLETELPKMPGS